MYKLVLILTSIALLTAGSSADAQSQKKAKSLKRPDRCVGPEITLNNIEAQYPAEHMSNTSNLRRKTGIALIAAGDRIYFTGKIVDSRCVPVPSAKIEIWHADIVGAYSFKMNEAPISRDENFIGTGTAKTDNEGNFSFLTIFPGNYLDRAPHINYRITHDDFKTNIGTAFFEYHPSNNKDPVLAQFKKEDQPPIIAQQITPSRDERMTDRTYHVKIVVKGKSQHRNF